MLFAVRVENLYSSVFSAPESKAQVHYCDHALSDVGLSVRLFVNNLHFRLSFLPII